MRHIVRSGTKPYWLVRRAQVILVIATGANNGQAARRLSVDISVARLWRGRWLAAGDKLAAAESAGCDDKTLGELIGNVLADEYRCGAPATFTAEQNVRIIALACEDPQDAGRPISHWTPRELADEAVKRGIVESISGMTVARLLKRGRSQAAPEPILAQCAA